MTTSIQPGRIILDGKWPEGEDITRIDGGPINGAQVRSGQISLRHGGITLADWEGEAKRLRKERDLQSHRPKRGNALHNLVGFVRDLLARL